ncbi:hypothetical protein [Agrobacterium tumefaciens]|uniref:hypothetical protein n=1 Tax=Agrobacterium tumefaciens TaxID=358 RepID=UPI003BA1FCBD
MAVEPTTIKSVRAVGADGAVSQLPWEQSTWYLVRDDQPFIDILVYGQSVNPKGNTKIQLLDEPGHDGARWQRWDFGTDLARRRRLGEISLELKVPKACELRCYVIPTALLTYRDVVSMVEDIESELGFSAAWDMIEERPDRSWSHRTNRGRTIMPLELMRLVAEEYGAARSIRREPFSELGPHSQRGAHLSENAIVSHWSMRRGTQLRDSADATQNELDFLRLKIGRGNPEGRQVVINDRIKVLEAIRSELSRLTNDLAHLCNNEELSTLVYPSPLSQRDYRLRILLRAFAPLYSDALSEMEASRSHYPPVFLNRLWELWGAVWLAKELRLVGFSGPCTTDAPESTRACSWHLGRGDIQIDLDFEPEPSYIDYQRLPSAHRRTTPALEWAALHQELDEDRPFLGTELRCSPDYLLRISTSGEKFLIVGDAVLATPGHHSKGADSKTQVVERYRRSIGWSVDRTIVRCHPLGGFVLFPPPAEAWEDFERLVGASDCTLICPNPGGDHDARFRFRSLLSKIVPELDLDAPLDGDLDISATM